MIKTYSYANQGNVYCSPHTQVKELASKSGNRLYSDVVLVDDDLMVMVERLFEKLRCKYYLISSGYRTAEHDRAVGGNGSGQHTKGKAVDACFYDQSGKPIPAQIVCCVAQDLGFNGIANISKNYRYVHLDTRSSGKYYGDETKGANTVTSNFYEYFGVSAADVAKYTGEIVAPNYFARYAGNGVSIVAALKSIGENSSYAYRSKIAKVNGIAGYRGTATQNTDMLNRLKQGTLIKP